LSLATPRKGYKSVPWLFGKEIELPEEWEVSEIQNHAKITTGDKDAQNKVEGGKYPFFVRSKKIEKINSYSFDGEAILTAGDGEIGKIVHYINDKFDFHQRVYKISNFDNLLNGRFFYYYFSKYFLNRALSMSAKNTVDSVRMEMITKMLIHLPPLPEQQKIATILSNVDNLIESTEKVIAHSKKVKTGLMQKLLTRGIGHVVFKKVPWLFGKEIEIPEEWELKKLQNVTDKIGDGIHSTPNYVDNSEYYFINGTNLINGKIMFSENTKNINEEEFLKYELKLNKNTLLLSINGTIGNVAFYNDEKIVLGKSASYIICNHNLDVIFFFYLLQSSIIKKYLSTQLTGTTIFNLSLGSIRNMKLYKPSLPEQQKIATILSNIDDKIMSQEQYKKNLEKLKKSLMQKLLTGEVRVKL
jgi:type I restriction enzyme, S subunit